MKSSFTEALLVFAICLSGCSRSLSREEARAWVMDESNGVHVTHESNGFEFDVIYDPYAGVKEGVVDSSDIRQIIVKIRKQDGSDLLISDVKTLEEAQQSQYYFSYGFQQDLSIQVGDSRLPCEFYHFEQSADPSRGYTFHLMFDGRGIHADTFYLLIESPKFSVLPIRFKLRGGNFPKISEL